MNPWRWVDPRAGVVRLAALRAYLESRGWQECASGSPGLLRFQREGAGCVLPRSEAADDYVLSVTYALTTLSEIEDRHPLEVLEDVLAAGARRPTVAGATT